MSFSRLFPISTREESVHNGGGFLRIGLLLAALVLGSFPLQAEAGVIIEVEHSTATAGGTGSFDLVLLNGGGAVDVSGFSFELSVAAGSGVTFTGVDTNTSAPYLFGTLQQSPFTFNTFPTYDFTASDSVWTAPGYVTLSSPDVVGLEHVSYQVAPGTPAGGVPVSIVIGDNSQLLDANGNPIPFIRENDDIIVTASVTPVPEPSSLLAGLIGVALVIVARRGGVLRPGGIVS